MYSRTATDKHIHLVGGTYVADTYTSIKGKEENKSKAKNNKIFKLNTQVNV